MGKLRVFLVDDHPVVRAGLRGLINAQPDMEVVGEAFEGAAALRALSAYHWAATLDTPENKAFMQAYQQKFNKSADAFAVQGYDAARVIVEALNKTQGDASNKDRLLEEIAAVKFVSPRGPFEFDPESHNVVHNEYVREVREVNGKVTNVVLETIPMVKDKG